MRLEQGKIDVLAELGEARVPELCESDIEVGARRFANAVRARKSRQSPRRLRLGRVAVLLTVAACSAAAAIVALQWRPTEQRAESATSATGAPLQVELDATDEDATRTVDAEGREWFVTAVQDTAALRMVSGARALLGPSSQAWCWSERAPAWLHLEIGQVDVTVPRLRLGQSLTIHTPNASVIVHGTAFTVQVIGGNPPVTIVGVREGIVEVREGAASTFLHAGEVWRSGAKASPAPPVSSEPLPSEPERHSDTTPIERVKSPPAQSSAASSSPASESSLARENALFREASQARQRGDFETSQATLAKLLTEFPKSPMRATALVERAFALSRLGRTEQAAVVAKQALSEGASEHVREQLWRIAFGTKPAPSEKADPLPSE